MIDLTQSVQYIKGVGPNRAELLNTLGIYTLGDLITYFPREYEDRSKVKKIEEIVAGEEVTIEATVVSEVTVNRIRKNMTVLKTTVEDETGKCTITWFNQTYVKQQIKRGQTYRFFGKVEKNFTQTEMRSPVYDEVGKNKNTGKIMPIYPSTYKLSQTAIRQAVENSLKMVENKLEETLPEYLLSEYNLEGLEESIRKIHFPTSEAERLKARKRLVFEELLSLQLALLELKGQAEIQDGICYAKDVKMSDVINNLPFKLTKAQLRVLEEIDKDMESPKVMNRLLQGDVGSGKTVVAMIAAYKAVKAGYQVAVMAPTAILATQHLEEFQKILEPMGIRCSLLLGATKKKEREEILEQLADGTIQVLIGTHALITDKVIFHKLGLVVTDEQHRFGVRQRAAISDKGINPDVLVMTATPIPRTLALILYGDLDISIIDELPPNRKKIETFAVTKRMEERVNNFICKNIDEGRQVYVVCPLVEEKEEVDIDEQKADLKAVKEWTQKYQKEIFPKYKVECVYGKMKPKEKDEVMEKFKNGEIDILVSTTVIEVGVNVPNASVMVVENSERFGLAQLHQLRGRVGRGAYQSYCILKYDSHCSQVGRERMKTMQETNDGFVIAEKDLELRGTGEFFGTKQHGLPEFKIANLFVDMPMLKSVQSVALKIEADDKGLKEEKNIRLRKLVDNRLNQSIAL
ncbi:MAG: ATP-dependent DNA helicase RecG [Clostridia bacterium]|nr:ATP-dependent DNA helicase RecG [Clostridia bacterium]MCI9412899.1 ATP-dependent DNA helicase RecG [Clostridia bacterium]